MLLLLLLLLRLLLHLSCRCFLRAPALGGDQSRRVVREGGPVGGGCSTAPTAALSVFSAIVPVGGATWCPAPWRHGYEAARLKLISQVQVLLGGGEAGEGVQGGGERGSAVHCNLPYDTLCSCTKLCTAHYR